MILQKMMQAAHRGMTPEQFFQQNEKDPEAAKIAKITKGKSRDQLMETAGNMAQQRGTTLDAFAQQMGIRIR